ncbi:MAG TPA: cupredoxin domain-containing protein [Ilumatobacteraceae bacterium]|jgi:plastocyanin|nr:cupredoxin domain-containing protein [Ilumatobacteraceae bacterium]
MPLRLPLIVALGSMVLWGCGSDDGSDGASVSSVAGDPLPTAAEGSDDDREQVQVEIAIADFQFVGDQDVLVGGRVVVTNTDDASHTLTAVDGSFDSGTLAPGDSYEFTVDESGTFEYRCEIHPSMTGSITATR